MAKYHVNPATGNPAICKAKKSCPFGDLQHDHYLTAPAARAAYEMKQQNEIFNSIRRADLERIAAYELYQGAPHPTRSKRPYLNDKEMAKINTDGIACGKCGAQFAPQLAAKLTNESNFIDCPKCNARTDIYSASITVGKSKDTYPAFVKENVYKMKWYHGTEFDDWDELIQQDGGFYAHVGSQQAAFDRRIFEQLDMPGVHSQPDAGFWVYEVQVDETATIDDEIAPDDNADYSGMYSPSQKKMPSDVIRYINKWEDMASVSLVIDSTKIKVLGKRFVTADEAFASPSLYNVKI